MGQRNLRPPSFEEIIFDPADDIPYDLWPMMEDFLIRREKEIIELQRLVDIGDFVSIRFIGHRLKGTGGGFGLPVLSEIGAQLEEAAKTENSARIRDFIGHLAGLTALLKMSF